VAPERFWCFRFPFQNPRGEVTTLVQRGGDPVAMVPQEAVQTRKTLVQGIKSKVQAKTEEKGTIESFMKILVFL
jgi:hypothetical protein